MLRYYPIIVKEYVQSIGIYMQYFIV